MKQESRKAPQGVKNIPFTIDNGYCLYTPLLVTFKRTLNTVPTFVSKRAKDASSVAILPHRSLSTADVFKENLFRILVW